jgi:hypothetical protein
MAGFKVKVSQGQAAGMYVTVLMVKIIVEKRNSMGLGNTS